MNKQNGFVVQKVSEFGTTNENVARIILQTLDLTRVTTLEQNAREQLFLAANEIAHRLASAQSAAQELQAKITQQTADIEAGKHLGKGGQVEIPYIPALQILFEGYYYNLKNVLRDLGGTPCRVLFGKRFEDASAWYSFKESKEADVSKHLRRMEATHPGYSTVRELIEQNKANFRHIISVRNALEHPGGSAGTVRVVNWRAQKEGIAPPHYFFEGDPEKRYELVADMLAAHEAMLALVETVLVFGLMFFLPAGLGIQHLNPEKRNPKAPTAFRVVQILPEMELKSQPFSGRAGD